MFRALLISFSSGSGMYIPNWSEVFPPPPPFPPSESSFPPSETETPATAHRALKSPWNKVLIALFSHCFQYKKLTHILFFLLRKHLYKPNFSLIIYQGSLACSHRLSHSFRNILNFSLDGHTCSMAACICGSFGIVVSLPFSSHILDGYLSIIV